MQTFVIVVHLMIVLALIGFVLLQKSEGGGFAAGSTGGSFLSSRGSANVLTRATAFLAAAFFGTSLILSILAGMHRHPGTILQPTANTPGQPSPSGAPATPLGGQGGGLLDELKQREQAPAQPAGPQVPQPK